MAQAESMTRAALAKELRTLNTCGVFPGVDARMARAAEVLESPSLPGWHFLCNGDDVTVVAPNGGPGFKHLGKGGRREARILHALVRAILQERKK